MGNLVHDENRHFVDGRDPMQLTSYRNRFWRRQIYAVIEDRRSRSKDRTTWIQRAIYAVIEDWLSRNEDRTKRIQREIFYLVRP